MEEWCTVILEYDPDTGDSSITPGALYARPDEIAGQLAVSTTRLSEQFDELRFFFSEHALQLNDADQDSMIMAFVKVEEEVRVDGTASYIFCLGGRCFGVVFKVPHFWLLDSHGAHPLQVV